MADEARLSGINWRETFPFTHLFRSFRIAVHPSKLALGLIALLSLYVGGIILDRIWPVQHRAVPGEVELYQQHGTGGRVAQFVQERRRQRAEIESNYASLLLQLDVVTDRAAGLEAAREAGRTREARRRIRNSLSDRVARIDEQYESDRRDAADIEGRRERNVALADAWDARQQGVRSAYDGAVERLRVVDEVEGVGLFRTLFAYQAAQVNYVVDGVVRGNWLGGLRPETPTGVIRAIINFFAIGPLWMMWHHPVYFVLYGLLFLAVWSIFGGAIARIAAVHVARDEKLSVRSALSFSAGKFLSFASAPLIPIIIIIVVGLIPFIAGLLASIWGIGPIFNIAMGILFALLLAAGFIMTLVLIGLVAGLNLMYPTIAVEGSDSFDAISRSFSYVYARPWRMLFYTAVAVIYGALTYLFVRFFIFIMLAMTHRFVNAGMFATTPSAEPLWQTMWPGPSATGRLSYDVEFIRLRWDQDIAAGMTAFWIYLLIGVLGAFAVSFYFTANTIIYYLMRHEVDATEMDDVYLEQSDEDFGETAPITSSAGTTGETVAVQASPGAEAEAPEPDDRDKP